MSPSSSYHLVVLRTSAVPCLSLHHLSPTNKLGLQLSFKDVGQCHVTHPNHGWMTGAPGWASFGPGVQTLENSVYGYEYGVQYELSHPMGKPPQPTMQLSSSIQEILIDVKLSSPQ